MIYNENKLMHYKILMLSGTVLLPLSSAVAAESSEVKSKPNVIYILADDLGIGDLGCYGQRTIKTPGIDRLAQNGMLFTRHYSGSTVSAPSRCALMTGKHVGHCYIRGNKGYEYTDGRLYDQPLAADEVTVAEIFKQKDYQTACIGKWGLGGPESEGHPNNQGFDYFFGYLGQGNAHSYYPVQLFENGEVVMLNKKVYSHDLIADKAMKFIDDNADRPFFLYYSITLPHAELVVPEEDRAGYANQFPEIPFVNNGGTYGSQEQPRATYAAMVTRIDRDVQRIVDLLDGKGILDNTIIIFTSDNGVHKEGGIDPDFFDSNGPFRGNKRDLYDGGIRTPFIVSWPAEIVKGSVSYHPSAFWDFLPTVCDLLEVETPDNIDGISMLPEFTGDGIQKKHDYLYFEFHEQGGKQAVVKDNWKLIKLNVNNPSKTKLELYNFESDPGERANVASQYPEKVEELSRIMEQAHTTSDIWKFNFEK